MQITETRKAIIELIEPYMNKTLSEWCLVKDPSNQIAKIISIHENFYNVYYIWIWLWAIAKNCSLEIIWHYDITAVLKYIDKYFISILCTKEITQDNIIWFDETFEEIETYNIPNKPLHLYDTNEEENLLKLLQSLNK